MSLKLCTQRRVWVNWLTKLLLKFRKIILQTWGYRLGCRMCGISSTLLPVRPDACRCYRCLPNRLSRSLNCKRLSQWIKVWQTNPLYKGLSSRTSQISLFCSTLNNEGDYVIIPENPCITYKQVCLHTGEENHPLTLGCVCFDCDWFWIQLVSTLFSQSHLLQIIHSGWGHSDVWPGQQTPVHLSGVIKVPVSQVQTRATHSQSDHFADWKWKVGGGSEKTSQPTNPRCIWYLSCWIRKDK